MFSQTLTDTLRHWRLLALLFGLTVLPALTPALALYTTINDEANQSVALDQLLPGFNYTVFADFMHDHGGAIWPLIRTGAWTAMFSLLIGVWTKGGILGTFAQGFSMVAFWKSGTYYFARNARLLGVTALLAGTWVLVGLFLGVVAGLLLDVITGDTLTERGYVVLGTLVAALTGFGAALVLCVSQYASVFMYQTDETSAWRAYQQSWRLVRQQPRATFGRFGLIGLFGAVLMGVYLLLESAFSASNWLLIGLLFIGQQLLVFTRITLSVWSLRVAFDTSLVLHRPPLIDTTADFTLPITTEPT